MLLPRFPALLMRLWLLLLLALAVPSPAAAYSVLTHQAIVDSTWSRCLRPLLAQRYPGADSAAWLEAKSYAYGGAIIQDMGYYPLGAEFFTDLTHYVRAGSFVRNLLREAHNRNEYAFALGALSHYAADLIGHPECTNQVMPAVYPDLRREFGAVVTYDDAPVRHTELEFAFDVVQVAAGRYRTQDYHKYVGFRVSKPVLERAFQDTYGLELGWIIFNVDLGAASFRYAVNRLIPTAARAAWHHQRKEIRRLSPRARRRDYMYHNNRRRFEQEFGDDYERPGFGARVLSWVLNVLPKIGPLKPYAFTLPGPEGEQRFRHSFRDALARYCTLAEWQHTDTTIATPDLPNANLDTGHPTYPNQYGLADATYAHLLRELHQRDFKHLTPALRQHLLDFFAHGLPSIVSNEDDDDDAKEQQEERRATEEALVALRAAAPVD